MYVPKKMVFNDETHGVVTLDSAAPSKIEETHT